MKLDSLDQLVEFLNYKGLKVSDLTFSVNEDSSIKESQKITTESKISTDEPTQLREYSTNKARITSLQGSPEVTIRESDTDVIYVKDFESIPNSCHMGKINMLDRELYAGICTEGDDSKISLSVSYYKGETLVETIRQFKMVKIQENQEEEILLNIS